MNLKLIACNVFTREASLCLAQSPHLVDAVFTELGEHVHPDKLREQLQALIDATEGSSRPYDAIALLFGLCGNATVGLRARSIPVTLPRSHDCCGILLGSRGRFQEHFADDPSTPFGSTGYMERGEYFLRIEDGISTVQYGDSFAAYVEQYGEENAQYIWDAMHPKREGALNRAVFIDIPETAHLGYVEEFQARAAEEGKAYTYLQGDLRLIRKLLEGDWDAEEFLVLQPGEQIAGVYDWKEIMRGKAVG